jgi:group I intron endonuclease
LKRTCYIYLYVNQQTKIAYIGKTSNINLRDYLHRYAANVRKVDTYFYNAIRKYGLDAFKRVLITTTSSDEEAYVMETRFISEFRRLGFKLYNLTDGGDGLLNPSEETKQKIRDGQKNRRPLTPEDRLAMSKRTSGSGNPMFGRKHSTDSISKNVASNRIALLGEKNPMFGKKHSHASKIKMSEKKKGSKASDETKAKMSARRKKENNSFFGKTHSPEIRAKLRISALARQENLRIKKASSELAPFDVWI